MKKTLIVFIGLLMASCVPTRYCQVYQTKPISDVKMQDDALVFEDDNCIVYYDFWKENGEIGFKFFNKTLEYVYLPLEECFYVENGCAFDYCQDKPQIVVPPKTLRVITKFNIKNQIYRSCDLLLHPGKKDPNSLVFSVEDTPLRFGNIISYHVGDSKEIIRVINEFYVSGITNCESNQIAKRVRDEICGIKQNYSIWVYKEPKPDRFYIWHDEGTAYFKY